MNRKKRKTDISLLIPAYNEEANIEPLVEKIAEFIKNSDYKVEAVIVNDGSTDKTNSTINKCAAKYDFIISLGHRKNMGVTASLVTAFKNSTGDYVIVFPADLQYLPECIPDLIAPLGKGYDLVTGWKEGKYGKKFVSFFYNRISRKIFKDVHVHDLNSVKAMKRDVFKELQLRKDWHRYIVPIAAERGYKINEVRVKLYPRIHGESKYSGRSRIVLGIFDMLSVKFLLSFSHKPLLFFGVAGLILTFIGISIGVLEVVARVFFQLGFRPVLYLVMLLITVGVIFFAIGFLAELIVIANEKIESFETKLENMNSRLKRNE